MSACKHCDGTGQIADVGLSIEEIQARIDRAPEVIGALTVKFGNGRVRPWAIVCPRGSVLGNRSTRSEAVVRAHVLALAPGYAWRVRP